MASHTPTPGPGGGDPRPPTRRTLGAGSAFAAAVAAFAVVMMGTTLPTPLYAIYGAELGFGVTTTTVIFAVYAAGVIAALIVFGRWSDVIGRRPLLLAGVAISAISAVVFVTAGGLAELLAGRVISGLSAGIYTGTATAAVIELAPRSWQSRAPAIATAANMGGLGLGPLVAGILAQYVPAPLHTVFVVDLVALAVVGVAIWFVAEPARLRPGARLGVQRLSVPPQVREVFTGPAIAAFAGFAVLGTFTAVAPSFLAKVIGIDNHAA
ncbi:MAG: MFS transporter, partial [Gordonia polyisoprenivorans]|nr:MFS transporter [Gordonia polyisoprenivorans]